MFVPAKQMLTSFGCAVYFVQGILGLSRLGVTYLYKDEFHLDPASVRPPAGLLRVLPERMLVACSGTCCSTGRSQVFLAVTPTQTLV